MLNQKKVKKIVNVNYKKLYLTIIVQNKIILWHNYNVCVSNLKCGIK